MTVNILGTKYKIIFADENEKPKLKEADGYMDHSIKEIVVGKFESDPMSIEDLGNYSKKVLRHEIIHAFLYESGLWQSSNKSNAWALSEEMVDWIAIQSPKLFEAFKKCDCL